MIINPYSFGVAYDPDAQAFFTASGLTGATNLTAINQLVLDLKTYGIWTKMKAIYPMIGGTAALHKWNLKDPRDLDAAFRLVFSGGWTHSSTGALPNGTNGWANTYFNPVTQLTIYSCNIGIYTRTNSVGGIDFGTTQTGTFPNFISEFWMGTRYDANGINCALYDLDNTTNGSLKVATADSRGLTVGCIQNNTNLKAFKNGVQVGLVAGINTSTPVSYNCGLGALYLSNNTQALFSNKEYAFACVGNGLTNTENANLYTAVQAYNTTLARQV